jgi:hypothetical protein
MIRHLSIVVVFSLLTGFQTLAATLQKPVEELKLSCSIILVKGDKIVEKTVSAAFENRQISFDPTPNAFIDFSDADLKGRVVSFPREEDKKIKIQFELHGTQDGKDVMVQSSAVGYEGSAMLVTEAFSITTECSVK